MKVTETQQVLKEVVTDVVCDVCGKSCKDDNGHPEFLELQATWGYGSGKDLQYWSAHVCESCVDEKFGFVKFQVTGYGYA